MAKKNNLEQFMPLLREYLHLSPEEVESYLTGALDGDSLHMVEEHIRRCPQCAREVAVMRECVAESRGLFMGALDLCVDFIGNVLQFPRSLDADFDRFWLGDVDFPLTPVSDHPGLMEAKELSLLALRRLRREDLMDPGRVPVAVEGSGRPPVVTSLSSFETVGDFRDFEGDEPHAFPLNALGICPFHLMAPSSKRERDSDGTLGKFLEVLPGKGKEEDKEIPKPTLILKCRAKDHNLELFHDAASDKVLLRVNERKDGKA